MFVAKMAAIRAVYSNPDELYMWTGMHDDEFAELAEHLSKCLAGGKEINKGGRPFFWDDPNIQFMPGMRSNVPKDTLFITLAYMRVHTPEQAGVAGTHEPRAYRATRC